ncbi:MAG: CoA transferase [Acidimicrobiales bacterium]
MNSGTLSTSLRARPDPSAVDWATELCEGLGLAPVPEALPGADLAALEAAGRAVPPPGELLRTADGWIHPGPAAYRADFEAMVGSLGAPMHELPAERIDAEAGAWLLPAVAVRSATVGPPPPPAPGTGDGAGGEVTGAVVVVLGAMWAVPLAAHLLARLGARVLRVVSPRWEDRFVLAERLGRGTALVSCELQVAAGRRALADLLSGADLLIEGTTPRVLANAGFGAEVLAGRFPGLRRLSVAALDGDDRPGFGFAAECRAGWAAARPGPPALGSSSVADPLAGLLAAHAAAALLGRPPGPPQRLTLEGAVTDLLKRT